MNTNEEIWVPVVGYEGIYEVSNLGRIKALQITLPHYKSGTMIRKEKFLKPWDKDGYRIVGLSKNRQMRTYSVHRVVAIAFMPNLNNLPEVNHIDADKSNNKVSNLEWCDRLYNSRHAAENGLMNPIKGENHWNTKLTELDVFKMRHLYESNPPSYRKPYSCDKLGKLFGVSKTVVAKIIKRTSWTHI